MGQIANVIRGLQARETTEKAKNAALAAQVTDLQTQLTAAVAAQPDAEDQAALADGLAIVNGG